MDKKIMAFNISPDFLKRVALLESNADPLAMNPNSSAKGLFQFTNNTAKQYGLQDPLDPIAATQAFRNLTADNYATMRKLLGREPTEAELYLAHQQGATGAARLINNPDKMAKEIVGKKAVRNNGGSLDMTAADFANHWKNKYDATPLEDPIGAGDYLADRFAENKAQPMDPLALVAQADNIQTDANNDEPWGENDQPVEEATSEDFGQGDLENKTSNFQDNPISYPHENGYIRTIIDNINQGSTAGFGDEAIDAVAAGYGALTGEGNYSDLYKAAREMSKNDLEAQHKDHPYISGLSQVGGMLAGGVNAASLLKKVLPAKTLLKAGIYASTNPLKAASLAGAGGLGLYGAGTDTGDALSRLASAGGHALIGGILGPVNYKLVEGVSTLLKSPALKSFISDESSGPASITGRITPSKIAGILDEDSLGLINSENPIRASLGQTTKDPIQLRKEQKALEALHPEAINALSQQQEDAYRAMSQGMPEGQIFQKPYMSRTEQGAAEDVGGILQANYDELGKKVSAAYKAAEEGANGVGIKAQDIHEKFLSGVDDFLASENVRPGNIPKLDTVMQELRDIIKPMYGDERVPFTTNKISLDALEKWNKGLTRLKINTLEPADKRILENVSYQYRNYMSNIAEDALVGGDKTTIEAFRHATGLAKQKFEFLESNAGIEKILENRELSGNELVNILLGSGKSIGKGQVGTRVGTALSLAGDKAPQMLESLKLGVRARILKDAMQQVGTKAAPTKDLLSFRSMQESVGNLISNKEFFEAVFNDDERVLYQNLYKNLRDVAPRLDNFFIHGSKSGPMMQEAISNIANIAASQVLPPSVSRGLIERAASLVRGDPVEGAFDAFKSSVAKGLEEVSTPRVFYGGYTGSQMNDPLKDITDEMMKNSFHVTVGNPRGKDDSNGD